ncbi:MAG: glycosyltransferase family 2 protein [Pseudomonadota bacterium]
MSFTLDPGKVRKLRGWNILELTVAPGQRPGLASLVFRFDADGTTSETVELHFRPGRTAKRFFLLDNRPSVAELHISGITDAARISHLRIAGVPALFATRRILQKLSRIHPLFSGESASAIRSRLMSFPDNRHKPYARALYDTYRSLLEHKANPIDYLQWIDRFEQVSQPDAAEIARIVSRFQRPPVISILLPVYNTDPTLLSRCIASVRAQSYPHWELCIADDASTDPAVRSTLEALAATDDRIIVTYRSDNGHISAATNTAMELANGDYLALLDHDDELAEHALLHIAQAVLEHPGAKIVYSDDDKIDELDQRYNPHMKPDWNPDLLLSQNYITHLLVVSSDLMKSLGGMRPGFEGSQDHDLLLRCAQRLKPGEIVHVPRVLYHWRAQAGSTAQSPASKDYTTDAGLRAIRDHLERQGLSAVVTPGRTPNTYRVKYPLPAPPPRVSIIIPTRDQPRLLRACIDSILTSTTYPDFEILILDNQTSDPAALEYLDRIAATKGVSVLRYDHPFNYSALCNFGARQASGDILCFLNNDTEVITPEWLEEMVAHAVREDIGCVGAKLLYSDGSIQHAGVILGIGGVAGHAHKHADRNTHGYFSRLHLVQNLSAVTGACLVVRREIFEQVAGFNETDLPVAFNDVDFCLRVRQAGYRNLWTPYAELYHHESKSRGIDDAGAKAKRAAAEAAYMKKIWGDLLYTDPAYNRNLSLLREDFSLRI